MSYTTTNFGNARATNRWDAKSSRLRGHMEALLVPAARWGSHRNDDRPASVRRQLAHGDYVRD